MCFTITGQSTAEDRSARREIALRQYVALIIQQPYWAYLVESEAPYSDLISATAATDHDFDSSSQRKQFEINFDQEWAKTLAADWLTNYESKPLDSTYS